MAGNSSAANLRYPQLPYTSDTGIELYWNDLIRTLENRDITISASIANPTFFVINDQTGTSYSLGVSDSGKKVRMDNASSNTLTIPAEASQEFLVGSIVKVTQVGAGQTQVLAAGGVTINFPSGPTDKIAMQWGAIELHKVGVDEWDISGDLSV